MVIVLLSRKKKKEGSYRVYKEVKASRGNKKNLTKGFSNQWVVGKFFSPGSLQKKNR